MQDPCPPEAGGRETVKHAAVYSGGALIGRLAAFVMLPFYAHILRDEGYAVIGMLDLGLAFLVSLLAYGLQTTLVRLFHDESDPARRPRVIATGTWLVAAVAAVLAVPFMAGARPLAGLLLDQTGYAHLVVLALAGFVLEMTGQAAGAWLLIGRRSALFSLITLVRMFTGLGLNIYLILIRGMGLDGYFISSLVSNLVACVWFVLVMLRGCGAGWDRRAARAIVTFTLPLVPGALVSFASRQVERLLVRFRIDFVSVGVLEMAYRFPVLLAQLVSEPFMKSWDTKRFEIADRPDAPERIGRMYTLFLFLMCWAGVVLAVVIEPLLQVLTPPEFHGAARIARVEIVTMVLAASYYHFSFGIIHAKHTGLFARIRGWTSVLKIGLSWLFIGLYGIAGVAFSAAVTAAVSIAVAYPLAQRRFALRFEWGRIVLLAGAAVALFALLALPDHGGSAAHRAVSERLVPAAAEALGGWKDGRPAELLRERAEPLAAAVLGGLGALVYGLLLPAVHEPSRRRLIDRFTRRRER